MKIKQIKWTCFWDKKERCYKMETGKSIAEFETLKDVLIMRNSEIKLRQS